MKKIGRFIVNHSLLIIVISLLLFIPAIFGFIKTRINYDILVYLPDDVETVKGEKILTEDFGIGSYAFIIVDNMSNSDILKLENKLTAKYEKDSNDVCSRPLLHNDNDGVYRLYQ